MLFSLILSCYFLLYAFRKKTEKDVLIGILFVAITVLHLITNTLIWAGTVELVLTALKRILILLCGVCCIYKRSGA